MISLLLPFGTALLFYASFHPLNLYVLAWVALIPLTVYAAREERGWRAFLLSWLAGYLCFFLAFQWTGCVVPVGPWLIPIYKGLHFGFFALIVRSLWRRGVSPIIAVPLVWTTFEYLRCYLVTGMPWFYLGHTQYDILPLIQICDVTGVYGVTFLVAMANGLFAHEILLRWGKGGGGAVDLRAVRRQGLIFLGVLAFVLLYGFVRMETLDLRPGPDVVVIQANVPQEKKKSHSSREIEELQMSQTERAMVTETKPDLVVWAETMFPVPVEAERGGRILPGEGLLGMEAIAGRYGVPFLFGVAVYEQTSTDDYRLFNSALLISRTGEIQGRYDKIHLVPFGEYIPLRTLFPFIEDILKHYSELNSIRDLTPGERYTAFPLGGSARGGSARGGSAFGVLICFESIFPGNVRELRNNGADFVVNISNDGWFRESAELDQMLVITQFRAVENRTGIVRATNTGISAFISPTGQITDMLVDTEGRTKSVAGVLRRNVMISDAGTVYTAVGDLFALTVTVILFIMLAAPLVRRLRRR